MLKIVVLAAICFAAVSAYDYDVVQEEEGQQFYLLPLQRQRRDTTGGISRGPGRGVVATIGHQGTIYDNGVHRLDGSASASKQFRPNGPGTIGGNLDYSHIPSGSNLKLGAQHTQKYGTDFSASGTANLWKNGNSRLDAVGTYDRHYGGQFGTGNPNYYGGLNFNHRF